MTPCPQCGRLGEHPIAVQLNEFDPRSGDPGFAFTFNFPAVPAVDQSVHIGGRDFVIKSVELHPLTEWPVRLYATEIRSRR